MQLSPCVQLCVQVHWFLTDHGYADPWYQWNTHRVNEKGARMTGSTEYTATVSQDMIVLMHIQMNGNGKINTKTLNVMSELLELDYFQWKDKAERIQNDPIKAAKQAAAKQAAAKKPAGKPARAKAGATSKPPAAAPKNSKRKGKPNKFVPPPAPAARPTPTTTSTSSSGSSTSDSTSSTSSDSDSD